MITWAGAVRLMSNDRKNHKKVKCDGQTDGPTDRPTDRPTKRGVESLSMQLKRNAIWLSTKPDTRLPKSCAGGQVVSVQCRTKKNEKFTTALSVFFEELSSSFVFISF